ncbi:phage major capsid protein [Mycolicibacterium austroafricanum]|uniref:Phage major capsid protein n=1 Tax=Mycolicibacterium austroafricanum TaxID=39687 RepID=A0ABT8HKX3_MYCAO|nr:phage major capsid protein [Mycolicibacterium austroafricanum]MDN4521413.1 phage major capsid protein [Mycolicibacterium austroafricanum]
MPLYTTAAGGILTPEEVGALVVQPVERASVAMQIATVVPTNSGEFRIPIVTNDAIAAWTPEGSDITPSDAGVDEITIKPDKLAALSIISNELAQDSSPAATELVGNSIGRDLARKVDAAFFAAATLNGPDGVESIAYQATTTTTLTNTDAFAEAISLAENEGATVTAFVANAATVLALSKVKRETGSNEPLLQPDPTLPTRRQILGVPLWSVPDTVVPDDVVWAIDGTRVFIIVRQDVDLRIDPSRYFESDRLGIRATMRVGFGFPHEAAVVCIGEPQGS